jgi:excisionase family DNA binding protein
VESRANADALSKSTSPASYNDVSATANRADITSVDHDCMTAKELAIWLRVNRKTVYEYAARNVIPSRRLGRRVLFHRGAVAAWLARASTEGSPHSHR